MNRSAFPKYAVGMIGTIMVLSLLLFSPLEALHVAAQGTQTPEPPPTRPTAEPTPYIELNPVQGVAGEATVVAVTGGLWAAGHQVTLYWDATDTFLGQVQVNGDGTIQLTFTTPTGLPQASVGQHTVLAIATNGDQARATFELVVATPTFTPEPTNTLPPTDTPPPTNTPLPTDTPAPTDTPIPTPTLRPITPMVTITPIPPTKPPARTNTPAPTRTNTPIPGTPTNTLTPSVTPTPSNTPGPGTPSATPPPTPTPEKEISDTGGGWGTIFLWGFALAGLLIVFRWLRVKSLSPK